MWDSTYDDDDATKGGWSKMRELECYFNLDKWQVHRHVVDFERYSCT